MFCHSLSSGFVYQQDHMWSTSTHCKLCSSVSADVKVHIQDLSQP